jgi:hypothetical protein
MKTLIEIKTAKNTLPAHWRFFRSDKTNHQHPADDCNLISGFNLKTAEDKDFYEDLR